MHFPRQILGVKTEAGINVSNIQYNLIQPK